MLSIHDKCIKCGACIEKCRFGAIKKQLSGIGGDDCGYCQTENQRILQVRMSRQLHDIWKRARQAGIEIPTLCYLKEINAIGSCRMCVVEVKGARGPSCCMRLSG